MDSKSQWSVDLRLSGGLPCGMVNEKTRKPPPSHSDADKKVLGKHLADARKNAGYTLEAASKELGFAGKQGVGNFESGKNVIDALRLQRLAQLYEVTLDALVGGSPLSPAAMRMAIQYDQMDKTLREDFDAMWTTYLGRMKARLADQEVNQEATTARDRRDAARLIQPDAVRSFGRQDRKASK